MLAVRGGHTRRGNHIYACMHLPILLLGYYEGATLELPCQHFVLHSNNMGIKGLSSGVKTLEKNYGLLEFIQQHKPKHVIVDGHWLLYTGSPKSVQQLFDGNPAEG